MAANEIVFDTDVSHYQRYLLLLQKLQQERYAKELENFFWYLVKENFISRDSSAEDLYNLDFSLIDTRHMEKLRSKAPRAWKDVQADLAEVDAYPILEAAGYTAEDLDTLGDEFVDNVRLMSRYEQVFMEPDPERPSLTERLRAARNNLLAAFTSEKGQLITSSIMFSIAVGAGGGLGIALTGASLISKLAANQKVGGIVDSIQQRMNDFLVKVGVRKTVIERKEDMLSARLAKMTQSRLFKGVSYASLAMFGTVGLTALLTSDAAVNALGTAKSVIGGMLNDGLANAGDAMSHANQATLAAAEATGEQIGQWRDSATPFLEHLAARADALAQGASDIAAAQSDALSAKLAEWGDSVSTLIDNHVESVMPPREPVIPEFIFTNGDAALDEVTTYQANGFDPSLGAPVTSHIVVPGDTLWAIASEHYQSLAGAKPTDAQIIAMINDMGMADPNHIVPGQQIHLPSSVDQYAGVRSVANVAWLSPVAPSGAELAPGSVVESASSATIAADALAAASGTVTLGGVYRLDGLAETVAGAMAPPDTRPTPELIEALKANLVANNPGVADATIGPGKDLTVMLYGGGHETAMELTTPTIKEHVFHSVMGPAQPGYELVDKDAVYRAFKEANPDFDFRSGLFGIPLPGSGADLAERMIQHGEFNIPTIDPAAAIPQSSHVVLDGWYSDYSDVTRDILRQAYPDGVPDILDKDALIASLETAHPELKAGHFDAERLHFDGLTLTLQSSGPAHTAELLADAGLGR